MAWVAHDLCQGVKLGFMLNLVWLRALVTVSETGSINQAAAKLGYTTPALSQQLAKLESNVGHQLLLRKSYGCELTAAGQTLVSHAQGIFERIADAEDDIARLSDSQEGRCVIGCFATAGISLVPPVLRQLQQFLSGVSIELQEIEPPAGLKALADGKIDFAISHRYSHGEQVQVPAGVIEEPIGTDEILAVAGIGSRLASAAEPVDWVDLAKEPLVCGPPELADRIALEAVFEKLGLGAPHITHETANYEIAARLAEQNLGVAFIPRMGPWNPAARIKALRVHGPCLYRTITIAWRERYPTAPVVALRRLFKRAVALNGSALAS
jgi:DNA-binding transcriptional LysR family regulator